jgi:hypothetical protein
MTRNPHTIETELERRMLHGLACEWEAALWVLDDAHRRCMKKPLFSIRDLKDTWGSWSARNGEISLSRRLVMSHPWDAVRDVLLHEMAHQMAEQVLGGMGEAPHGTAFLKACHLLRANAKASGTYPLLRDLIHQEQIDRNDRILIRIRKLLALAQSRNRHEAEAAMLKAHELIATYNIDRMAMEKRRRFFSVFLTQPALRHSRDVYHLAHLIQEFYFVQGIWVPAYVMQKGKMGRTLEISGTRQNIAMAGYVYDFVRRFIETEWTRYNRTKRLNRFRGTDFAVGIIEGFRQKLSGAGETKAVPAYDHHPMLVEDPQLKKYVAYKYPHTTSFRRAASGQDQGIVEDGMKIGRKLVLHQGLEERKAGWKPLIEYSG